MRSGTWVTGCGCCKGRWTIGGFIGWRRTSGFDIVHFMLHGSIDDLTVSGGRLTRNAVLQLVTLTGAKIVFLNACSSAGLGQMLVNAGVAVAIASVAEVEDERGVADGGDVLCGAGALWGR